jgi:hypothetical protein
MSVDDRLELVPSYDHGLSLGSTDEDDDKLNVELSDYVNRYSQSCFQEGYNKVPNLTVFDRAAKLYPEAAQIWLERLKAITPEQINEIFDCIPEGRITPVAATFAKDLLAYNIEQLLSLDKSSQQLPQLDEQAIATAIEALKQEVRETCNRPTLVFDEDTEFYLRVLSNLSSY